jgi:hypothetical protein
MKHNLELIEWVDAHNIAGSWYDDDELSEFGKNEAYRVTSVGYCVYEDSLCVVLSGRLSPETDDYPSHFGMLERLPKKMIDKRTVLIASLPTQTKGKTE